MTTQNDTRRMMNAFKRAQADVASLADWIECELDKHNDGDEVTWASVSSLELVREQLIETLAFFSGVEQSEIRRSLIELRL